MCRVMLCCACVALCYVLLCCVVRCGAVLCGAVRCGAMLCCVVLCCAVPLCGAAHCIPLRRIRPDCTHLFHSCPIPDTPPQPSPNAIPSALDPQNPGRGAYLAIGFGLPIAHTVVRRPPLIIADNEGRGGVPGHGHHQRRGPGSRADHEVRHPQTNQLLHNDGTPQGVDGGCLHEWRGSFRGWHSGGDSLRLPAAWPPRRRIGNRRKPLAG